MGIKIGTTNPGQDNKSVGGTNNSMAMGAGSAGVCGTPVWNDSIAWDDLKMWLDS